MAKELITMWRAGVTRNMPPNTAKYAMDHGWVKYVAPPAEPTESLTELKARIKSMATIEEVNQALVQEQGRQVPRESVIKLCNQLIAEWS